MSSDIHTFQLQDHVPGRVTSIMIFLVCYICIFYPINFLEILTGYISCQILNWFCRICHLGHILFSSTDFFLRCFGFYKRNEMHSLAEMK